MKSLREDTGYIQGKYPKLWKYLEAHSERLDSRKSRIYADMPRFAIFGIGDYAFKPYKVAICSMYQEPRFCLVMPTYGKPAMLDDISYYLSFDSLSHALFTWSLLNSKEVREFLSAIVFEDSKRLFTKEVLMRIDLGRVAEEKTFDEVMKALGSVDFGDQEVAEDDYAKFTRILKRCRLTTSGRRK